MPRPSRAAALAVGALALIQSAAVARAQEPSCRAPDGGPSFGLALSGGGARGFAHVGVLRALDEAGVRVDCVAGTSMGAVIGALYASGHSVDEIERILRSVDWPSVFEGRSDRSRLPPSRRVRERPSILRVGLENWTVRLPSGALSDQRINRILLEKLSAAGFAADNDFDRLPIPYRAVAADLHTGRRVVLARGDLALAARASMSIPVAFAPVSWGPHLLVDGGIFDNVPVFAAREMGARRVLAVDVTSPTRQATPRSSAIEIALTVTDVLAQARNDALRAPADVSLRPDLAPHTFNDYGALDDLVCRGYEAMRLRLEELRAQGQPLPLRGTPDPARATDARDALEGRTLSDVEWRGLDAVRPELAARLADLRPGQPLRLARALRALDALQAADLFRWPWVAFERQGDGAKVVFDLAEAEPWSLEAGGGYDETDEAQAFARLRRRNLFGGGERFTLSLFASDAEEGGRAALVVDRLAGAPFGLALEALDATEKPRFYDEAGQALNRARFQRLGARLTLRRELSRRLLLSAGVELGQVRTRARDRLAFPAGRDRVRLAVVGLDWDTLDDAGEPERGGDLRARFERSLPGRGASHDYWRLGARGLYVLPLGPGRRARRLRLDALLGFAGRDVPAYELHRFGGPDLVPGRRRDEVWGRQTVCASLAYSQRLFGRARVVLRAGAGGAWDEARDIRLADLTPGAGLALEHPTPLGPIALSVGRLGEGRTEVYASIGWR
jgi:NTE family protein